MQPYKWRSIQSLFWMLQSDWSLVLWAFHLSNKHWSSDRRNVSSNKTKSSGDLRDRASRKATMQTPNRSSYAIQKSIVWESHSIHSEWTILIKWRRRHCQIEKLILKIYLIFYKYELYNHLILLEENKINFSKKP